MQGPHLTETGSGNLMPVFLYQAAPYLPLAPAFTGKREMETLPRPP